MDGMQAYLELKKGGRLKSSLVAPKYWIEMMNGKTHTVGRYGASTLFNCSFDKFLEVEWEFVTEEKTTKVDIIKETVYKAECPKCLSYNTIPEKDALSKKADYVVICSKCGYDYGLKDDSKENVKSETDSI
jgi:predicted RNA-binding Zn-ribbon protein involved in translation (DUF1610 family)